MCGISGIFDTRATRPIARSTLLRMSATLQHRGPDGSASYLAPGIGLAHQRLAVIDLLSGAQPLFNESASVALVCNGEIYNHHALRAQLQAMGHVFASQSDCEVIVHAWEAWGLQCLQRLRGMFAFALWDRNQQTLLLVRDRLGVKPLYYALLDNGMLLFASEAKALLAHGSLSRQLDPLALDLYFSLGYVAEPHCIFRAMHKLAAGHMLLLRRSLPVPAPQAWWDLRFTQDSRLTAAEAQAELRERLREAVSLRMQAEVPLGAFLSGGLDSSSVVALMAQQSHAPVQTLCMGFGEASHDESLHAAQLARRYRTDHHMQRLHGLHAEPLLDTLAALFDEPYADSSAIPTYRICQLARQQLTVVLSGDGGDEAFAGYSRYRTQLRQGRLRSALPLGLRRLLFGTLARLLPQARWQVMASDAVQAYWHGVALIKAPQRRALYSPRLRALLDGEPSLQLFQHHARAAGTQDPLALVQYLDCKTYLVDDINTKVDRCSMAHALEVREPLMDHELLQWLATLPSRLQHDGRQGKLLLRQAMAADLPPALLQRPKQGFAVPLADWLRGPLKQRAYQALLGPRLQDTGLLEREALCQLLDCHMAGAADCSRALWALLMFEAFLRVVVDAPSPLAATQAAWADHARTPP